MSKTKARVWCQCPEPVIMRDGNGEPFSAEPICRAEGCRHPVKRRPTPRPDGRPLQALSPTSPWDGSGPCPSPPETATEAYLRGAEMAASGQSPSYVAPPLPPRPERGEALALLRRLRGLPAFPPK